jgi:hypothetical protein
MKFIFLISAIYFSLNLLGQNGLRAGDRSPVLRLIGAMALARCYG